MYFTYGKIQLCVCVCVFPAVEPSTSHVLCKYCTSEPYPQLLLNVSVKVYVFIIWVCLVGFGKVFNAGQMSLELSLCS